MAMISFNTRQTSDYGVFVLRRLAPAPGSYETFEKDTATMVNILFLDLDGVVCCNFRGELERDKLQQVRRICEAANAKVVLSTDWRRRPDLKQRAERTLASVGVEVIGATPQYAAMSRVRPLEILSWMKTCSVTVDGWCAVDDRDLVLEEGGQNFTGHFVLTEFHSGLTPPLADQ